MLGKYLSLALVFFFGMALLLAQPAEGYRFPIDEFRLLSGTYGELRTNHFHAGIDVKTGGRSGAPLYAIADGFVYRIKISPNGYGNAIYLRHEDGKFSVYGHMASFNAQIAAFARQKQLQTQRSPQEIYLQKDEIKVRKGELIGFSGNSGRSFGPHLHFEIRDSLERPLNPMHFYPGEIRDNIAPILLEMGFEPLDIDSRVSGEFRKVTINPTIRDGKYVLSNPIRVRGNVGIEFRAYDLLNGARNRCGINYVKLYVDEELIYDFALERFAFDETRYINQYFDYAFDEQTNRQFEKAYIDEGNEFPGVVFHKNKGIISLEDDRPHAFRLELIDGNQNLSEVSGTLRREVNEDLTLQTYRSSSTSSFSREVKRNVLIVKVDRPDETHKQGIYWYDPQGVSHLLKPAYTKGSSLFFLLALDQKQIPKRIRDANGELDMVLPYKSHVFPRQNTLIDYEELSLYFPYKSTFDTLALNIQKSPPEGEAVSSIFTIGEKTTPLFRSFELSIPAPVGIDREKLVMAKWDARDKEWNYQGQRFGSRNDIRANSSSFGTFALVADSAPPEIRALNFVDGGRVSLSQKDLRLRLEDNFSGINFYEINGRIDGEWVIFSYDPRYDLLKHVIEDRPARGEHELSITVHDRAGNSKTVRYRLVF